jgi:ribosomal protein L11 methyltransferase
LNDRWLLLSAKVPDAVDDEIAAVLGSGSLGVEIAPAGPGMSELKIYLKTAEDAGGWRLRAAGVLSAHGLPSDPSCLSIGPIADERWVERWQAALEPIPLGSRFIVWPTEAAADSAGRDPIRLIPGMAFGTGEHETTRLCAAGVERAVMPGSRWLDLGTGTGILAIVAARCGASRVLAVDIEPDAAAVAVAVVARNRAAEVVEVRVGSIDACGGETFDGIVANIQSSFFISHAPSLVGAMAEGGVLLASGFLVEDVPEIARSLEAVGLTVAAPVFDGAWAFLLARRGRG